MHRTRILVLCAVTALLGLTFVPVVRAQKFVTINYPDATYTEVRQINDNGLMVGRYIDTSGVINAFTLSNGVLQNIDVPGEPVSAAWGVNNLGQIVGRYFDGTTNHGFLLGGGKYTTLDPPGSTDTFALGINDTGQIVGDYTDSTGFTHGWVLTGGSYSTMDVPNSTYTEIVKINNAGMMVGDYGDAEGNNHGFVFANGTFTTVDFPGSFSSELYGLNNGGELAGGYQTSATSNEVGFTDANGTFSTVDFPAAVDGMYIDDVNDANQLVGVYFDADDIGHAFVTVEGPLAYVTDVASGNVFVVDTASNLVASAVPVGSTTFGGIAVTPDGSRLYVSNNSEGNTVSVIATSTDTVTGTITFSSGPSSLAISPDGSSLYVALPDANSVAVVSTATNSITATIPVGVFPEGIAFTPGGAFAYVANEGGSVSVIDTATEKVVATIPVGSGSAPIELAITPNGQSAYVTGLVSPVAVINTATNTVVASVPVGSTPNGITTSPDGTNVYVANLASGTVSVISTATNSVAATVPVSGFPRNLAVTPDGSRLYVTVDKTEGPTGESTGGSLSVINTATNAVAASVPVANFPDGIVIAATPPTMQTITQPLSPTAPNTFNFGPHNFTVQYPPGTSFSGVNMSVTAAQTPQATFQGRVAGTAFAKALCIIYSGAGGNCVDYQVTCSNTGGGAITCPSTPTPSINVKTSYDTTQSIVNPGFLTAPIGTNQWQNIFTAFYLQRIDPTTKGRTIGFSEFFAVDLGATNLQGEGTLQFLDPLRPTDPRVFSLGKEIPVEFQLASIAKPGTLITDATASLSLVMVADAKGNATSNTVLQQSNAFLLTTGGTYVYPLSTKGYAAGVYVLTVYGNAFPAQQVQLTLAGFTQ